MKLYTCYATISKSEPVTLLPKESATVEAFLGFGIPSFDELTFKLIKFKEQLQILGYPRTKNSDCIFCWEMWVVNSSNEVIVLEPNDAIVEITFKQKEDK